AVLGAHVLTSAALQDQTNVNIGIARLLPVEYGASRAQVIAGVCAIDAVDRILPEKAFLGGVLHGQAAELFQFQLVHALGGLEEEIDCSSILADWKGLGFGQTNILGNQLECKIGFGAGRLEFALELDYILHIRRQISRCTTNEFKDVLLKDFAIHLGSD